MNLPMPNAWTGGKHDCLVLRAWARPAVCGVSGLCVSADPNKQNQKNKRKDKQKRYHDNGHEHHDPLDEATLDEDSVPGEAERPTPPSEKPESCQR